MEEESVTPVTETVVLVRLPSESARTGGVGATLKSALRTRPLVRWSWLPGYSEEAGVSLALQQL